MTAIVHAADGVRFVATAACPVELLARIAGYIRGRCDDVLWSDAARQVHELLDGGDLHAAIALYFARTGERWDQEHLDLVTVSAGAQWIPADDEVAHARR